MSNSNVLFKARLKSWAVIILTLGVHFMALAQLRIQLGTPSKINAQTKLTVEKSTESKIEEGDTAKLEREAERILSETQTLIEQALKVVRADRDKYIVTISKECCSKIEKNIQAAQHNGDLDRYERETELLNSIKQLPPHKWISLINNRNSYERSLLRQYDISATPLHERYTTPITDCFNAADEALKQLQTIALKSGDVELARRVRSEREILNRKKEDALSSIIQGD